MSLITPHGFRHLSASLLVARGVPIPAVSARLGHTTTALTMRVYAHAFAGDDAQAARVMEGVLRR